MLPIPSEKVENSSLVLHSAIKRIGASRRVLLLLWGLFAILTIDDSSWKVVVIVGWLMVMGYRCHPDGGKRTPLGR